MPAARRFERRDRDQLAALVNLHVATVIPGVALSVNAVLGQLEREPAETIVDPWVAERLCLVLERDDELVAATLLHRFGAGTEVGPTYRGSGQIRWLICKVDGLGAGAELLDVALAQMRRWQVSSVEAEVALPAIGCHGVPDSLAHIRALLHDAGFGEPRRVEHVLAARCEALAAPGLGGATVTRSLGRLGARFELALGDGPLGFVEVCDQSAEMARSSVAARWADVGDLVVADGADAGVAVPALLAAAADWLSFGGVTRLVDYWAPDVDSEEDLRRLTAAGFRTLTRNARGIALSL